METIAYRTDGTTEVCHFDDALIIDLFFRHSFKLAPLRAAGIITVTDNGRYRWTLSKSSLVDYVKHITGKGNKNWYILEKIFGYKPGTLRRLASTNGNVYKLDNPDKPSKDFSKVIEVIGSC